MVYDAIVVGLGGMGSAAVAHAARRGMTVLGLEQFQRGHAMGASSGRSRIIRKAYFEHAAYVPLVARAYTLWETLARETQLELFSKTGVLLVGLPTDLALGNARASAALHDIPIQEWSAREIGRRYPRLAPRPQEIGIFEPAAGSLMPELAVEGHLRIAESAGAQLSFDTAVVRWSRVASDAIDVEQADGTRVRTRRLALCTGPWFEQLAHEIGIPLVIERRVQHWFAAAAPGYGPEALPTFIIGRPELPSRLYGFPDFGDGVKAAFHHVGAQTHPRELDRTVYREDIEPVRAALEDWIPGAAARYLGGKVCMYAMTPDEHFVVGEHPGDARVVIAGGFSGHGFKFAAAIGEVIADLLAEGGTRLEIGFLSPQRFDHEAHISPATS